LADILTTKASEPLAAQTVANLEANAAWLPKSKQVCTCEVPEAQPVMFIFFLDPVQAEQS
jgi:hypothetical protein